MTTIEKLIIEWLSAKQAEAEAVEHRRAIEDDLTAALKVDPQHEGVVSHKFDAYTVKITSRLTRKIDADKLQEIAAEHDLTSHLSELFRWKPEIDIRAWKASADSVTKPLLQAITTTPGRPSYSITAISKE